MKRQVGALIKALPYFGNVGFFLLFMLLLFSILGLYQYNGVIYNRCRLNPVPETNTSWAMNETEIRVCSQNKMGRFLCYENETCGNPSDFSIKIQYDHVWDNAQIQYGILNFDNLGTSLLAVFNIIITNEWVPLFYNLVDGDIPAISLIFNWFIIIFGSFFMLNLILAVIIQAFIDFQKQKTLDELEDLNIQQRNEDIQRQEQAKQLDNIKIESCDHSSSNLLKEEQKEKQNLEQISQSITKNQQYLEVNSLDKKEKDLQDQLEMLNKEFQEVNFNYARYESLTKKVINSFKNTNQEPSKEFQLPKVDPLNQLLQIPQPKNTNHNQRELKERIVFLMGKNIKEKFSQSKFDEQKRQLSCANNFRQLSSVRAEMKKLKHSDGEIMKDPEIQMLLRAETNCFYDFCFKIQRSPYFQMFVQAIIIANTVVLSLDRYPISDSELFILNTLNGIFTVLFVFEMALKICGMGFKYYFGDRFNVFDFLIVLLSLVDMSLVYSLSGQIGSKKGLSAFRTFRLMRIFKLAKHWSSFQLVLKAVTRSIKDVGSFSILLALFIYIYTLLGLELFASKAKFSPEDTIDMVNGESPTFNFDTFFSSLITVFVVLTNDGWSSIYFSYYRTVGAPLSSFFFISLIVIGQKIMLNLFLATLLKNFDQESFEQLEKEHEEQERRKSKNKIEIKSNFQQMRAKLVKCFKLINQKRNQIKSLEQLEQGAGKLEKKKTFSFFYKEDIIEKTSLCLFSETNRLRLFIFKIINNAKFEILVQLVIILSGVHLALENPLNDPNGNTAKALLIIDIITTVFFTLEMIFKVLTFGFILNGEFSYLRNSWNILDFFIVVFSLASISNNPSLKIFKMFRILRPLRIISKNEGFRTAVIALVMAIPNFITILLIILLFFVIFGILGINYLKGQLFQCLTQDDLVIDSELFRTDHKWDCLNLGGEWQNSLYNFDNMLQASNTLFQMSSMSGWSYMMVRATGTTQINYVLVTNIRPYIAFYFVIFILIGGFFLMNLFVAVVLLKFQKQRDNVSGHSFLTPEQQEWVYLKLSYLNAKPLRMIKHPENRIKLTFFKLVNSNYFTRLIFGTILLNTLLLTIKYYNQPQEMSRAIEYINYVFTAIFALEAICKIIAYDKKYFKEPWNVFDFVIALGSIISIFLSMNTTLNVGGATSILRAFRVCRVLRLVKRAKNLKVVFNTFIVSLPAMTNVGGLLLLLIYLYSVIGVYLFANVAVGGAMTESLNFQTFFNAMGLLFVIATGDGWNDIMNSFVLEHSITNQCISNPTYQDYVDNGYETIGCGVPNIGFAYFYSFFFLVNLIFLNLFIAIILDGFNQTQTKEGRDLNPEVINNFREVWSKYDPEGNGFIAVKDFYEFLFDLNKPLGWDKSLRNKRFEQDKFVRSLGIASYDQKGSQGFQFMQVLDALATKVALHMFVAKRIQQMLQEKMIQENEGMMEEAKKQVELEYYQEMEKQLSDLAQKEDIQGIKIVKRFVNAVKKVEMQQKELNKDGGMTVQQQQLGRSSLQKLKISARKSKIQTELSALKKNKIGDQQKIIDLKQASEGSSVNSQTKRIFQNKNLLQLKMCSQSSQNRSINNQNRRDEENEKYYENSLIEKELVHEGEQQEEEKHQENLRFEQSIFYEFEGSNNQPSNKSNSSFDQTRNDPDQSQNQTLFRPDLSADSHLQQFGKKKNMRKAENLQKISMVPNIGSVGGTNELDFAQEIIEEEKDYLPFVDYLENQTRARRNLLGFAATTNNLLMEKELEYSKKEERINEKSNLEVEIQGSDKSIDTSDLEGEDE